MTALDDVDGVDDGDDGDDLDDVDALQATLAGEHAAVFAYGVLGGRTSQTATPVLYAALRDAYVAHRGLRDQLAAAVRDQGAVPVPAEVTYDVTTPPATPPAPAEVEREAAALEDRCAATYAALVVETVGDHRRWAIGALTAAAVRRAGFGAAPAAFPGAPELSS